MKKTFFNIASEDGTACLLLYGYIGNDEEVKSEDIVRELLYIENNYSKIDVRINSMGGEVYAGIAIFNALRNSKSDINIYIDGIAASIASVIAACGKPVHMSRYARMMIHNITGGCWGNKDDMNACAAEIQSLEDTLSDIYSSRCKKTKDEIKTAYFDGKDHWFTADEALSAGLIDDVFDTDPVPTDSTNQQIYDIYQNRLNRKDMNLEELKKKDPSFANCANDEDVISVITGFKNEIKIIPELKTKITDLENKVKLYEEKETERLAANRKTLLDSAVNDGRIKESQRAKFDALLKADPETGEAVLCEMKPQKNVMDGIQQKDPSSGYPVWEQKMNEIRKNNKID